MNTPGSHDPHIPDALLARFADCDLSDQEAVAVALHLDGCVRCEARVAALDPLTSLFASVDDPPVPSDLAQTILAAARKPAVLGPEPSIAAGLAAVAALAFWLGGEPTDLVARGLASLRAVWTVSGALADAVNLSAPLWAAVAIALLASSATLARNLELQKRNS